MRDMKRQQITLNGNLVTYRDVGEGEPVLLIHGIAGSSDKWAEAIRHLPNGLRVIAPDLLGHGQSAKPRGDYSLGAFATGLRDLLMALDVDHASIVGHSLGGGIAMQFAYQFPERTARLALVASGGLGREVSPLLRACALPGSELVMPLIVNERLRRLGAGLARRLEERGLSLPQGLNEVGRSYSSLVDTQARIAFVHTLRSAVDAFGQRIDATDRLHLAARLPTLIVWGARDRIIPLHHATHAHGQIPTSRLEVFREAGHFPHLEEPERFASVLARFIDETDPARVQADDFREQVIAEPPAASAF